jgi:predicted amidophosphoribosyltransferase
MKDSSKMLNFNLNRTLKFDTGRSVNFDINRTLEFNSDRDLEFDLNRDLGIRNRGVVFRGYVCPVCGASVAKDAINCDECSVRFKPMEETTTKTESSWERGKKVASSSSKKHRSGSKKSKTGSKKSGKKRQGRRETFQCPVCGKLLYRGTAVCPGCDLEFITSGSGKKKAHQKPKHTQQPICSSCGYKLPSGDRFCRRCGSAVKKGAESGTVTWEEYLDKGRSDGIVSWNDHSDQKMKDNRGG